MLLGIDDTDSPSGMCTTYLGALLARRLITNAYARSREARLPPEPERDLQDTGKCSHRLEVDGDTDRVFETACEMVANLPIFHTKTQIPVWWRWRIALHRISTGKQCGTSVRSEEAVAVLEAAGARYKGFKNGRGLIGATAAVASDLPDTTFEYLAYREWRRLGDPESLSTGKAFFEAEASTFPHTWDTVDIENNCVVCVPHTPDPVLFGIRGESPSWVTFARMQVKSEPTGLEQIFVTNQGTDAHLVDGEIGALNEGRVPTV